MEKPKLVLELELESMASYETQQTAKAKIYCNELEQG